MAPNEVKVKVTSDTKRAEKGFARLKRSLTDLTSVVMRFTKIAITGLTVGLGFSLRASIKQEEAVRKLEASMKRAGDFTQSASRDLQDFASQLQKTTTVGDETTLELLALARAYGANNEQAKEATLAAVQLAEAADINVVEAMRRVGRAMSGSTEDVSKFAPEIKNLTKEQLAAGGAARELVKALRGTAEAAAGTFAGKFQQLANRFGDITEKIGDELKPVIEKDLFPILDKLITAMEKAFDSGQVTKFVTETVAGFGLVKEAVFDPLINLLTLSVKGFELLAGSSKLAWLKIRNFRRQATQEMIELENKLLAKSEEVKNIKIFDEKAIADAKKNILDVIAENDKKINDKLVDNNKKKNEQIKKNEQKAAEEISTIAQLSADAQTGFAQGASQAIVDAKVEETGAVEGAIKKSLISQINATAAQAIQKILIDGLANAIPTFGGSLLVAAANSAAVVVAKNSAINNINAVKFRDGGIVPGASTVGDQVNARVNSGEMILNRQQQQNLFEMLKTGGAGGGATTNITIQAGAFMGDRRNARQFAKLIDEELFKLGRANQRVST